MNRGGEPAKIALGLLKLTAVIGRRDGLQPTDTFLAGVRAVEHNAHNLKIAGYTASEHKRATVAADP